MPLIAIDWDPPRSKRRRFVGLWLPLFAALVGGLAAWGAGRVEAGLPFWIPGAAVAALGILFDPLARWLFVGASLATWPIGWAVSHAWLGLVYYAFVTPVGLLLRAAGRDPLERRIESERPSYWTQRRAVGGLERYFRQY